MLKTVIASPEGAKQSQKRDCFVDRVDLRVSSFRTAEFPSDSKG